ncbi:MAG: type II toxin-antitoxin system VapC family toxin [Oscillatoriales cyanobacterium]|nr:MAG: type II toxin-antitoxin system VapC family toxin [Oscillatoriales cyanobacterium]
MSFLLDTCTVSELVARQANRQVVEWIERQDETNLHLSAVTIGEISRGIARLPRSRRRQELEAWLQNALPHRFENRILALDRDVMTTWGELVGECENRGRPLPVFDSLIAATARHHQLVLVTRNERDFEGTGVELLNPWTIR